MVQYKEENRAFPNTEENYITFSQKVNKFEMRFIDISRFLLESLGKLGKKKSKDKFRESSKYYGNSKLHPITHKCTYPYDYMNSIEIFNGTKSCSKEYLYKKLNDSKIASLPSENRIPDG